MIISTVSRFNYPVQQLCIVAILSRNMVVIVYQYVKVNNLTSISMFFHWNSTYFIWLNGNALKRIPVNFQDLGYFRSTP